MKRSVATATAFKRFLLLETPIGLLIVVPIAFLAAAATGSSIADPTRIVLIAVPITVPFIPVWWHFGDLISERSWLRAVALWVGVTAVPATIAGVLLSSLIP
jgi:hypothetical protein